MSNKNLVCPQCCATNRIPEARLEDKAKCGKCKKPLFSGKSMNLTPQNVASTLNHNEIPVLVDCWASWCGPCKQFSPIFEQAAKKFEPNLRFAKLDTEANQAVAGRWRIQSIPTLIVFMRGKEVARVSGAMSLTQLERWLKELKML